MPHGDAGLGLPERGALDVWVARGSDFDLALGRPGLLIGDQRTGALASAIGFRGVITASWRFRPFPLGKRG